MDHPDSLRVVIVGVGGIGSWLAEAMVRMLEFKRPGSMLLLVDGDFYEPKNAERQSFTQAGNKAEVKAAELQPRFPATFIAPLGRYIVEEIDGVEDVTDTTMTARSLLREGDIVFAVVDNFACRKLLFDAARDYDNIDIFTGGNDEQLFASVYHYQRRDGYDVTDHPGVVGHDEFNNPPDKNPGQLSCAERAELEGGVQTIAANLGATALLCGRFYHTILDGQDPAPAGEMLLDMAVGLAAARNRAADPKEQQDVAMKHQDPVAPPVAVSSSML